MNSDPEQLAKSRGELLAVAGLPEARPHGGKRLQNRKREINHALLIL